MLQKIKSFFITVWRFIWGHKKISFVVLLILAVGGYYGYKSTNKTNSETRYILASVTKGMIATSVSGTGQVEAADSKDIKTEASGEITYLNPSVKTGNSISRGTLVATIDNADALKTVETKKRAIENAKDDLETAQLALAKLIGADESNPTVKKDAEKTLAKAYEDGYNTVSSVFLDLPSIMTGVDNILYENTLNTNQTNLDYYTYSAYTFNEKALVYKQNADDSYKKAKAAYDTNFETYKTSSIYSSTKDIDSLITQTYNTSKLISQAIKDAVNVIQFYQDTFTAHNMPTNSSAATHISSLSTYLSKANSDVSTLFATTSTIDDDIEAIADSTDTIRTAKLNVKSKEQAIADAETALADAQDALSDYSIYANLTGIISAVDIESGDTVSSGATAASIITKSKIAKITLSESDIANIKTGDKATLTFDAIENLTLTGNVSEVDSVGAASSGVVSYGVEIAFDTNNESVKSGMSTSATIITDSKSDVLTVPTTAVKSNDDGTYYVQVLGKKYDLTNKTNSIKGVISATIPTTKTVTIGLADDTNTEITSGLTEGDQIVVRVSKSTTSTTSTSTKSSSSSSTKTTNSILNTGGPSGGAGGPPGM